MGSVHIRYKLPDAQTEVFRHKNKYTALGLSDISSCGTLAKENLESLASRHAFEDDTDQICFVWASWLTGGEEFSSATC